MKQLLAMNTRIFFHKKLRILVSTESLINSLDFEYSYFLCPPREHLKAKLFDAFPPSALQECASDVIEESSENKAKNVTRIHFFKTNSFLSHIFILYRVSLLHEI